MLLRDLMKMDGRVAVVTGGTGYLGSQMCESLCELGATVYGVSRGKSQDFSGPLVACEQFKHVALDLSKPKDVEDLVSLVIEEQGRIDVLVNNSYAWPKTVDFMQQSWDDIRSTLDVGIVSQLYLTKLVFPYMKAHGGSIINIASMYGKVSPDFSIYRGIGGNAIEYGASKAAMIQATRYLAVVGGPHRIRANSISPGPFPRPGTFDGKDWFRDELSKKTVLGRPGRADEIKGAIAFLASDMSSYVTGADIAVDGGWTAW